MTDEMKGSSLNTGDNSPDMTGTDFSKMSDEAIMNMDISDIFLEDLDSFLAEKEFRASKREMMETRAESLNAIKDADEQGTSSGNETEGMVGAASEEEPKAGESIRKAASETVGDTSEASTEPGEDTPEAVSETVGDTSEAATEPGEDTPEAASETVGDTSEAATEPGEDTPEAVSDAVESIPDSSEPDMNTAAGTVAAVAAGAAPGAGEIMSGAGEAEAAQEVKAAEAAENMDAGKSAETEAENAEAAQGTAENAGEEAAGGQPAEPVPPVQFVPPVQPVMQAPPATPVSEPPEEPKKKPGIAGLIFVGTLLCCAVIAIAAAYFYYADYFEKRFYPGTIINDRDVSVMEPSAVKQDIANEIVTYHLDIKELNDVTETITSEDIGLAYIDDGAVDDILKNQDTKTWFLQILGTKSYEVSTGTTYDREKAEQVVNGLSCLAPENITSPQDAQLVDNGTSFSIQPEVEGNELDTEKFRQMVFDALDAGKTEIDVVTDDCYLHPSIRSDDENLNTRMNEYNSILGVNVYYVFGENTEYVNADVLRQYITDDGNHVTLSDDYARKIVYGWGQKYDTFGLAREFQTHSGEYIMLPAGGDYGWVINKDVTIADVQDAVATQAAGERTPTFLYSAMGWDNGDITGTYVEVSIAEQKLWCYHNYELVMETDVVTGLPTTERETRVGIYAIDAKKEDAVLGTEDVQGYSSPVSFWAPFDGGRGLHDAPWRSSFGGNIYEYDGSHGCVNIPKENMEAIFNAIEIGNAVIVY